MEEAEAPFRCRLQKDGLKFSRDITKWEARAPVKGKNNGVGGDRGNEDEDWDGSGRGGGGSESGDRVGEEGGDGAGFFAFPVVVHNSHAHHVVRTEQDETNKQNPRGIVRCVRTCRFQCDFNQRLAFSVCA